METAKKQLLNKVDNWGNALKFDIEQAETLRDTEIGYWNRGWEKTSVLDQWQHWWYDRGEK
jgi:hypothetical protein